MPAKSKIKREINEAKADLKRLGVTQEEIAEALNTNRMKLNKLYEGEIIDVDLIKRYKSFRDNKLNDALNQIAA